MKFQAILLQSLIAYGWYMSGQISCIISLTRSRASGMTSFVCQKSIRWISFSWKSRTHSWACILHSGTLSTGIRWRGSLLPPRTRHTGWCFAIIKFPWKYEALFGVLVGSFFGYIPSPGLWIYRGPPYSSPSNTTCQPFEVSVSK